MAEAQPRRVLVLPTALRALRHRNCRLYFGSHAVSLVGTWMQVIARQWLIYRLTGSAAMLGTISFASGLPMAPLSIWAGSLADRYSRRTILVASSTAKMVLALTLAAVTWLDVVQAWHVVLLATALGAAEAIGIPAGQAFVAEIVEDQDDLPNFISLDRALFSLARSIGPALAGLAVATVGEAAAFAVNGLTSAVTIATLSLMRLPPQRSGLSAPKLGLHVWEAVRYLREHTTIAVLAGIVSITAFLARPYAILMPVFAENILAESAQPVIDRICTGADAILDCRSPYALTYGLLMAAAGLGAVIGALLLASVQKGLRWGRWLGYSSLSFPIFVIGLALSRSYLLSLGLLIGIGFSFALQDVLATTIIQMTLPDNLRGRVMALVTLIILGMGRTGMMQAGVMGDLVGAQVALGAGAAICLAINALILWRTPQVRRAGRSGP